MLIELMYPCSRIPDTKTVERSIQNLLFEDNPRGRGSYSKWREDLPDFVNAGLERFIIGLKKERARKKTCINLTPHIGHSWRTVLRGERIVEYPTLHVWLEGDTDQDMVMEEKILQIVESDRRKSDHPAAAAAEEQEEQQQERTAEKDEQECDQDVPDTHEQEEEEDINKSTSVDPEQEGSTEKNDDTQTSSSIQEESSDSARHM